MKEYIEIDACPTEEQCVEVESTGDYYSEMKAETRRMIELLEKRFPNCNLVRFKMNKNYHDFGTYLDIRIIYDDENVNSESQAYFITENLPERWNDDSIILWNAEELCQ